MLIRLATTILKRTIRKVVSRTAATAEEAREVASSTLKKNLLRPPTSR